MKFHGDKKYFHWGLTGLTIVCGGILFYYILFNGTRIGDMFSNLTSILFPIIVGFVVAYLLTPIVNSIEYRLLLPFYNKVKKTNLRKHKNWMRIVSMVLAYLIVFLAIFWLFYLIIPEIGKSIQSIIDQAPKTFTKFYDQLMETLNKNAAIHDFMEKNLGMTGDSMDSSKVMNLFLENIENIGSFIATLSSTVITTLKTTLNVIVGLIISVYFIYDKEKFAAQMKKVVYSLFEMHRANRIIKDFRFIHKTFVGFVSGKIVDSIIIGLLCFIGVTIMGLHYTVLISVTVGVFNVIPFFGPFLGAIPSILLLLIANPIEALYFLIFIIILQQLDGNVIGPKILGSSTGISGFWVIFSITLFGALYGIPGMFVGVPVFAVIFSFFKRYVNRKLKKKDLPTETEQYVDVYEINENSHEFVEKDHLFTEVKNPKYKPEKSSHKGINRIIGKFKKNNSKKTTKTSDSSKNCSDSNSSFDEDSNNNNK